MFPFLVLFLTTKIKAKIESSSLQVFTTSWNTFEKVHSHIGGFPAGTSGKEPTCQ